MRRSAVALTLVLAALGVAACGGGSSSSDPTSSTADQTSPEATWTKEVTAVMTYFENHVSAQIQPTIQDTYNQRLLEPLYRTYGHDLTTLATKLTATKPPPTCTAAHDKIVTAAHRFAKLISSLSDQSHLSEKQYSLLLERRGEKIHDAGIELTELTAAPSC